MSWTREKCLSLIDEYETKEELWNPQHREYYNKVKKQDAWVEIGREFKTSAEEVKKKIDSLLSSFRREKAKIRRSVGTGTARKDAHVSKWFAFERMHFLLDRNEPRNTSMNEENTSARGDHEEENPRFTEEEIQNIEEGRSGSAEVDEDVTVKWRETMNRTGNQKRSVVGADKDSQIGEALSILKKAVHQSDTENRAQNDDCAVYGQHVANKLRRYTPRVRNIVQYHLNTVLYHADMGNPDIEIRKLN